MSNDDWYLIDDEGAESFFVSSHSSRVEGTVSMFAKRDISSFDDMPPPAAVAKKAKLDTEDVVDLISDSDNESNDNDCGLDTGVNGESNIQKLPNMTSQVSKSSRIITSRDIENICEKENNNNIHISNTQTMSLAQRLLAKTSAMGMTLSQQSVSSSVSNQRLVTTKIVTSSSISTTAVSSSSIAALSRPAMLKDRSNSLTADGIGASSVPNSQASVASSSARPIVINTFCPSHDPSKHGRAIVDSTADIEPIQGSSVALPLSQSQQFTQSHSQADDNHLTSTGFAVDDDSAYRVLTPEQLQTWEVVLLVDQREKEHAFQQAKLLVSGYCIYLFSILYFVYFI